MMGAFFDSLHCASTYRGHFAETTIYLKEGKESYRIVSDTHLSWLKEGNESAKSQMTAKMSNISDGVVRTINYNEFIDGKQLIGYIPEKNVWSEKTREKNNSSTLANYVSSFWKTTLIALNAGAEFKTFTRASGEVANSETVFASEDDYESVFDSKSGQLKSFRTVDSKEGKIREFRLIELELNVPLPDSTGKWTPPTEAHQVPLLNSYLMTIFF